MSAAGSGKSETGSMTMVPRLCHHCNHMIAENNTLPCSKCERRWHPECIGLPVNCNGPWLCHDCSTFCESAAGSITSVNTTASARLKLKQLQEAKELEDKIQREAAERERQFLAEKHRLEAEAEVEQSGGGTSTIVGIPTGPMVDVGAWVVDSQNVNQTLQQSTAFENIPTTGQTSTPILEASGTVAIVNPPVNQQQVSYGQQGQQFVSGNITQRQFPLTPTGLPKHSLPPTKASGILESTLSAGPRSTNPVTSGPLFTLPWTHGWINPQPPMVYPSTSALYQQAGVPHPNWAYQQPPQKQFPQANPIPKDQTIPSVKPTLSNPTAVTSQNSRAAPKGQPVTTTTVQRPSVTQIRPGKPLAHGCVTTTPTTSSSALPGVPNVSQAQSRTSHNPVPMLSTGAIPQPFANPIPLHQQMNPFWNPQTNSFVYVPYTFASQPVVSNPTQESFGNKTESQRRDPKPTLESSTSGGKQEQNDAAGGQSAPVPSNFSKWQFPFAGPIPPYQPMNPMLTYFNPDPLQGASTSVGGVISAQQLAARHVVSKELPKFSGEPLEWPMFLNAFESTTAICGIQPDENLARLQKSLVGRARDMVQSILTLPSAISEIISTLRDECGRPDQLVHCMLSRVRNAPTPNVNKLETLVTFGREVRNLVTYIEAAKLETHLSNPMLLMELVRKLPPTLRLDWGLHAQRTQSETLKAFSDYLSTIKTAACHVSLPVETNRQEEPRKKKQDETGFVHAHSSGEPEQDAVFEKRKFERKPCLGCKQTDHRVRDCSSFQNLSIVERWNFVEKNEMCQRCLVTHGKWPCRTKQPCGISDCAEMHHKLLHPGKPKKTDNLGSVAVVSAHQQPHIATFFKIIPVTLCGKNKSKTVFAFLDDGSSITLLENCVAEELGLEGISKQLLMQWTSNVTRTETSSRRVELAIADIEGGKRYPLSNVCTVETLGLPRQTLQYELLAERYPHLRGLPVHSYQDAKPQILIGLADAKLMVPLKRRERRNEEPLAVKTRLGWTIFGGTRMESVRVMAHAWIDDDQGLHNIVKEYFDSEDFGISRSSPPEPAADQRAREILANTTKRTASGRFETGLLWKTDEIKFPNSYSMAERRMKCLERRLQNDPALKKVVDNQILEYLERGYAHVATEEELKEASPRVWYLPLGIVRNPRKPDKVRVVWDAAARVGDVSLNSMLMSGPDLLVPLPSVLSRFRQRQFAVAGDVKQMFHQLQIRKEDRQSQRFLYRTDVTKPPTTFVMDVATFGAACSPCSAQYVKNVNASEYLKEFPEAAQAIIENTYVDDFLDSRDTIRGAAQLVTEVREVFQKACFEIRNWQSNSEDVLQRIGGGSPDTVKKFAVEKSAVAERVLGIMWLPEADVFVFRLNLSDDLVHLLSGEDIPTKRLVLRVVMSIFDPLGFITTFTIHGKVLIQDIWRSGVGWDERIIAKDFAMWQRWIRLSNELAKVRLPRCYFPGYEPESLKTLELLVFTDASEIAYCAVGYFRIIDRGVPRLALVSSKSKVTPLKPQSIPRNESNASVMGVRLANSIAENHTVPITRRTFFTDSRCVTSWLRADPRKYRQYVAYRIAEILESSLLSEWLWLSTRLNVADKGTKWGKKGPEFNPTCEFYSGPEFALAPREEWPTKKPEMDETKEELRAVFAYHGEMKQSVLHFEEFSSFRRLLKVLALVFHFLNQCRRREREKNTSRIANLNQRDYLRAEKSLWRMVQADVFPDEVATLLINADPDAGEQKQIEKASKLYKLSPYLDEDGVVRMASRIDQEAKYFAYDFRNPVILPRDHHVTQLLILRFHQRYGHANTETVVNELRQKYYIPKLRVEVKKVVSRCQWCRVYRATPVFPKMAPLPQPRVTPYVRPFTFVGLDYFGPLIVKRGRTNEKRWVGLFTCLTVRAVHLEIVHSLSTESCKMAIRRFVARRGAPQQIYSDNGTNFRGSAKELADEIKAINRETAGTFTNADTEWLFNPPAAPHMGGVWERKVRAVKEGLKVLAHPRRLDDEGLLTLLTEVEMIVNSHPLTFVSLESPEQRVLTPNNFLLMSSSGVNAEPRILLDEVSALRSNWKLMQHLTDQFWKRWIKAYLPTIARRTKWFVDVRPLQEGDYVVIVDESVRNGWLRGRVIRVFPAPDGQVRKVDVQTDSGVLRRPAIKVALLDIMEKGKAT